jgi:anthranilate phosphoribosyltransferase
LSPEAALGAARSIVDQTCSDLQAAALLLGLRFKGEMSGELGAFAEVLRQGSVRFNPPAEMALQLLDCVARHPGPEAFAATIAVAVLCASAGLPVLIQASAADPPEGGSSLEEVLAAAGHRVARTAAEIVEDLKRHLWSFYSAEALCPPLARLRRLRRELGVSTVLDQAETLLNCSGAPHMLLGTLPQGGIDRFNDLKAPSGVDRLVMVQSVDGSEELPIDAPAEALLLVPGRRNKHVSMDARTYNLDGQWTRRYDPAMQAELLEQVLSGDLHSSLRAERNGVLYNTAFRLWSFGGRASMNEAVQEASELLKSGKGLSRYLSWLRRG